MASGVLVLMGGGVDSSYVASLLKKSRPSRIVMGIHFDYGQPGSHLEIQAAQAICNHLQIVLHREILRIPMLITNYELKGRNLIFLLSGAVTASREGCGQIAIGIHKGSLYYDASPEFVEDTQRLLDGYFGGHILISAPLLDITKPEIWEVAISDGLPIEQTYSCLRGTNPPCGICPSCLERKILNESYRTV